MQKVMVQLAYLLIAAAGLTGCASVGAGAAKPDKVRIHETVTLECNSAYRQGCRYRGQILSWDVWVTALGYSKEVYAISEMKSSGSRATVVIETR